MTLPSFDSITRQLSIPRCRGILPNGQYCPADHVEGEVADGKVHWGDDRRVTRAGIRRYLALAAWRAAALMWSSEPVWVVHYEALRMIPKLAKQAHVQLPHALGDLDRATLRAMLVNVDQDWKRREAMVWLAGQRQKSGGARSATP
jgi:hypothetical protein